MLFFSNLLPNLNTEISPPKQTKTFPFLSIHIWKLLIYYFTIYYFLKKSTFSEKLYFRKFGNASLFHLIPNAHTLEVNPPTMVEFANLQRLLKVPLFSENGINSRNIYSSSPFSNYAKRTIRQQSQTCIRDLNPDRHYPLNLLENIPMIKLVHELHFF